MARLPRRLGAGHPGRLSRLGRGLIVAAIGVVVAATPIVPPVSADVGSPALAPQLLDADFSSDGDVPLLEGPLVPASYADTVVDGDQAASAEPGASDVASSGPSPAATPEANGSPWPSEIDAAPAPGPSTAPAEVLPTPTASASAPAPTPTTSASAPAPTPTTTPWPWPSVLPTPPPAVTFRVSSFAVVRLAVGSRPYDLNSSPDVDYVAPYHDSRGVPMALIDGRLVYKPAGLGQYAILQVNGYRRTGDPRYLAKARNVAQVFVRIGRTSGGGLYIPYLFDFAMHRNPYDVVRKPWYSAMAQGLALSLFTRLYQVTGDSTYLTTARKLFISLRHIGRGTTPWVTWIDGSRYLWLEEYAQRTPEHTLNGFIFAVFGLYDYWLVTGDPTVLQEFRGALTTLKANVMRYRNPGGPIDYCLKHGKPQIKYHEVVIGQLRFLSVMTRDSYFAYVARVFARDA